MYLGLRCDSPETTLLLYSGTDLVAEHSWGAGRQLARDLLATIETFLQDNNAEFTALTGLFIYKGPGSFTGLRIGCAVMNTMAYATSIAIVGTTDEQWRAEAISRLVAGENDKVVLPHYGAEARITKPTK